MGHESTIINRDLITIQATINFKDEDFKGFWDKKVQIKLFGLYLYIG